MMLHAVLVVVLSAFAADVQAQHFDRSIPGVIPLSFERAWSSLEKRGSTVGTATSSLIFNYIVNITAGSPPQPITLSLDTGSSDTILLNKESSFCVAAGPYCPSVGYYNANKSSTYTYLNSNFTANFGFADQGQGSSASGDVATDTITIAGATIKAQQFAISYGNATIGFSILGLGYPAGENQVHLAKPLPAYDNIPVSLAKQGFTNLALFSLWKDSYNSHNGGLLFGGINTEKYTGNLTTLPIQLRTGYADIQAFDVLLNGVKLSGNSSFTNGSTGSVPVVLDCGSSGSILPDTWVQPIYDKFDVKYFQANDTAIIDCSIAKKPYTIDFTFGGLTISAPISGFVIQYSGDSFCTFELNAAGTRHALLGDNFLSNAFTVFDISNNEISLAPRNFKSTTDSIVAVPAGGIKAIGGSTTTSTSGTATTTPTPTGQGSNTASNTPSTTTTSPAAASTSKSVASNTDASQPSLFFTLLGALSLLIL